MCKQYKLNLFVDSESKKSQKSLVWEEAASGWMDGWMIWMDGWMDGSGSVLSPHHSPLYAHLSILTPLSYHYLPLSLAESGRLLSCVATATAASSSSTCCPPLPSTPRPLSLPFLLPPLPHPLSAALMALCQPLFTSGETPSSGGKTLTVCPPPVPPVPHVFLLEFNVLDSSWKFFNVINFTESCEVDVSSTRTINRAARPMRAFWGQG